MHEFINHTNHPSVYWSEKQLLAAKKYGEIRDMPFPNIDPHWGSDAVAALAHEMAEEIASAAPAAVLCQGEFTYCYALVRALKEMGIKVLAACTERVVEEEIKDGATRKVAVFDFVQFREY